MKNNGRYRVLRVLPRFDHWTLQDLRFSPDGEVLYVLGVSILWLVGAQSGLLLRVVKPRSGKKWSNENAVLSPDCRRILGMRSRMTLFSTRTGKLLQRFGNKVETSHGSCGDSEAHLFFSRDGRFAISSMQQNSDYETWVFPASGGKLLWHGTTHYDIVETARGQSFLDTPMIDNFGKYSAVLRRWSDGKVVRNLKLIFNYSDFYDTPQLLFSRDGRWIYFARGRSIWRIAMPKE